MKLSKTLSGRVGMHSQIALAAMAVMSPVFAQAANKAWSTTPVDATFSGINWATGTVAAAPTAAAATGDALFFGPTSTFLNPTNDLVGPTFAGLTFNAGSPSFTVGGVSFSPGGSIVNNSTNLQTISAPLVLGATRTVTTTAGGGNVTLSGIIGDAGSVFGLTKTGSGTLTLAGVNTFTGTTTINAGTVAINANTGLGSATVGTAPATIDGGTLQANTNGASITNTHVLTVGPTGGTLYVNPIAGIGGAINPNPNNTFIIGAAGNLTGAGNLTIVGNGSIGVSGLNSGVAVFGSANATYSGTTTIQNGGIAEVSNATGLGTGGVTLGNNGSVSVVTGATMSNAITVNGTGSVLAFNNGAAGIYGGNITLNNDVTVGLRDWYAFATARAGTINGVISGSGGMVVNGGTGTGVALTLGSANTYTGATTANNVNITLATATASINSSSAVTMNLGNLAINNTTAIADRIKDTATVGLSNGANVQLTGNAADNTETIGTLAFNGGRTGVFVTTTGTAVTTLAASGVSRSNFANALLVGSSLGNQNSSVGKISLATLPSGANFVGGGAATGVGTNTGLSIIPWMAGNSSAAGTAITGFVTYDTTLGSLRPLASAEYVTTLAAAAAGSNVKTITSETGLTTQTVNSLYLAPTAAQAITSSAGNTLTISSGALASAVAAGLNGSASFTSTISGYDSVNFGNDEAVVTIGQNAGVLALSSPFTISGAGNLTKTGAGTLALGAAGTYAGQTTINHGVLSATVNNVFNGTTGSPLQLNDVGGSVNIGTTTQAITSLGFTVGTVTGTAGGTLNLGGNVAYDASTNLNASNGTATISVITLNLNGNRTFNVGDSAGIAVAGTSELNVSAIVANGSTPSTLTKTGLGAMSLSGVNTYTGGTTLSNGTLYLGNASAAGTGTIAIASGATLSNTASITLPNTVTGAGAFTTTTGQFIVNGDWTGFGGTFTTVAATDMLFAATNISGGVLLGTSANAAYVNGYSAFNSNGMIVTNTSAGTTVARMGSYASVAGSNLRNSGASTGVTNFEIGNLNTNTTANGTIGGGAGTISLTKVGTGTLTLNGVNTYTGLTTVNGGTLQVRYTATGASAATPLLAAASGTDIQKGQVVFDYSNSVSPASTVRGLLQAGYATGFTTGTIKSSTATANKGIGYKDNGAGQVIVKATLYGDADLDGSVTIIDFNSLATNFGANTGKVWVDGDFDYDGAVGIQDFNALAVNFGQSLPPGSDVAADMAPLLAFAIAHDDLPAFAALTGVPEPTSLGLLAAGAIVGLRRRRTAR